MQLWFKLAVIAVFGLGIILYWWIKAVTNLGIGNFFIVVGLNLALAGLVYKKFFPEDVAQNMSARDLISAQFISVIYAVSMIVFAHGAKLHGANHSIMGVVMGSYIVWATLGIAIMTKVMPNWAFWIGGAAIFTATAIINIYGRK